MSPMVKKTVTRSVSDKTAKQTSAINAVQLQKSIQHHLQFTLGDSVSNTENKQAYWQATCLAINDIVIKKLEATKEKQFFQKNKSINYLSLEYLMGRLLSNNLHNLGLYSAAEKAVKSCHP